MTREASYVISLLLGKENKLEEIKFSRSCLASSTHFSHFSKKKLNKKYFNFFVLFKSR
jgi:ferredoxin-fold anticodon binding domain-containing protein